jgi:hypothetical protein
LNSEKIWKIEKKKKIVKWYGKYGRKVSWIVKRYGKCRRKVGWIVKWYGRM